MDIPGLTTYIARHPNLTEKHELHGGFVVVDGLVAAADLFSVDCNSSFAGDLDKYAQNVSTFIDRLRQCDIAPLVMLDGGSEEKKIDALTEQKLSLMKVIASYNPTNEALKKINSMALSEVFEAVLKKKRVKTVRCIFESRANIAAVAKILDCPVISNDAAFYIYGVKYIPVDSVVPFVARDSHGRGYTIPCELWRPECISKEFLGFDLSALPLAAVVLGSDDAAHDICERFFAGMSLSNWSWRLFCTEQIRIDTFFRWLRNYNLDDATAAILSKMPKTRRNEVLRKVKRVVNGYLALPWEMLVPLGLADKYNTNTIQVQYKYNTKIAELRKEFDFSRDVDALDAGEFWSEEQLAASEDSSLSLPLREETEDAKPVSEPVCFKTLIDTWPEWFKRHYRFGYFPEYFVNMKTHGIFDVHVQMEHFKYPSAHSMCMKIVGVIHGLLVAGCVDESARGLSYSMRDGRDVAVRHVDTVKGTRTMTFPALSDLARTPNVVRKQIFDDTLETSGLEALIDDVPEEWRLYVIAIVYWMQQPDEPLRNSRHMHAVLFAMLSSVVDRKIGFYRSMEFFDDRYGETLLDIESKRRFVKPVKAREETDSLVEALKSVDHDDCILAAPAFIKLSTIDEKVRKSRGKFDVTIVHVFAQFLSCIKEALHLNSLLGYPYEEVNIGDFFNGTMLYNLFADIKKLSNVEAYSRKNLGVSPSIRCLFKLLTAKVEEIIAAAGRKLPEDEPSKLEVFPDEVSGAQLQSIYLQAPFSTLGI